MNQIKTYYKQLPPWAKGVVGVGGVLVVVIVGIKAWKFIQSMQRLNTSLAEPEAAKDDLNYLIANGISPSFPNSQYEAWSNQLTTAFSGCGTDTGSVFNVFNSLNNEADLLKLVSTYGTRKYEKCLSGLYLLGGGENNLTLSAAISNELSVAELDSLNTILLNKGIKYRF